MKLRRRDPNQIFLAQAYYSLKRDGSETQLKKFRTMASLNALNSQSSVKRQHTNQTTHQRTKTIQQTQSRMKKSNKKSVSSRLLDPSNLITNVNQFEHLTTVHYMDPSQIKWACGLRNYQQTKNKRSLSQVPSAYYKATESSKNHHQTTQIPSHLNFNTFKHLTGKGQHPSMGLLKFEATLREVDQQTLKRAPELILKEKSFKTIPIKDRKQYPKLLNSQSLKKKTINPQQDMVSAFDGDHKYPSYTDRIILQKNYNNIRDQLRNLPRSKINLPSLGWQTNLRSYGNSITKLITDKYQINDNGQLI